MDAINQLVDRYVAVWNEPDAETRREGIAQLWAEDGVHYTPSLEARGYDALEARVTGAHEKFVGAGGFIFTHANNAESHHNAVRFNWLMTPAGGGDVAAAGFDLLILGDDGRIRVDYQFADPLPRS
jgi:hypothetical protein